MSNLDTYLDKRGITDEQMAEAFDQTQATINAYNLKQARIAYIVDVFGKFPYSCPWAVASRSQLVYTIFH